MLTVILYQAIFAQTPECLSLAANAQSSSNTATTNDFGFDVVSIRESPPQFGGTGRTPDGFRAVVSLESMIKIGYGEGMPLPRADRMRVVNLPSWASQTYQLDARVAEMDLKAWQNQDQDQKLVRSAMRTILRERFKLVLHEQQVELDGYQLVVRNKGVTFKPTPPGSVPPPGFKYPDGGVSIGSSPSDSSVRGHLTHFYGASMSDLANLLNLSSDRPIYDKTGLTGRYDFALYRSDEHPNDPAEEVNIFLIQDIGLELKPGKGPGLNLIIDHIERPTPN
jgi:uncharacterized protein (TIGR03435 family)